MTSRARLVGINHAGLEVDDLEQALGFYAGIFTTDEVGREPGMARIEIGDAASPHPTRHQKDA